MRLLQREVLVGWVGGVGRGYGPSDEVLCFGAELLVRWEVEVAGPVDDFAVGVVWFFGAEGRPADQTLEHDCADAPPVTSEIVALAAEDLWCDVIWCSDCGVGELTTRLAPRVDLVAIGYCELDCVDGD